MRNFGHRGQEDFWGLGVNGKNSEFHAAMGLAILPKVNELIARRQAICGLYDRLLMGCGLERPKYLEETVYNYAYYPVLFHSETDLLVTRSALNAQAIYPRRYFYPSLNFLPYLEPSNMPVAADVSRRVLCLPLFPQMRRSMVEKIAAIVRSDLLVPVM
jgi:dTDP-4-amino-4,6-dideoxygalactose transaminase